MKFAVIYVDPPWSFKVRSPKGEGRSAVRHYPTMTLERIRALPIKSLAAKDCALFLWATSPMLPHAIETLAVWGFKFSTVPFVWSKPQIGTGYFTRIQCEYVLLGTRGSPKRVDKSIHQHVHADRRRHSEKPNDVRDRIVQLMGDVPRIELFARQITPGWSCLGNELSGRDIEEDIREILK